MTWTWSQIYLDVSSSKAKAPLTEWSTLTCYKMHLISREKPGVRLIGLKLSSVIAYYVKPARATIKRGSVKSGGKTDMNFPMDGDEVKYYVILY